MHYQLNDCPLLSSMLRWIIVKLKSDGIFLSLLRVEKVTLVSII